MIANASSRDSPWPKNAGAEPIPSRVGLSPHELFAAYLGTQGVDDDRVVRLFARLLDEAWESQLPPPRQSAGGDA